MDDRPETSPSDPPSASIFTPYRRTQAIVILASLICIAMFWEGGSWLGIPPVLRFDGSLLAQPHWALAIVATYIMLLIAAAIGTVVAGWSWFFAGLFTAAIGLVTFSVRCGTLHYVLFNAALTADSKGIFLRLLGEQCLLFIPIVALWFFFWRRYESQIPTPEPQNDRSSDFFMTIGAIIAQTVLMGILVLLLAPTDVKKQVVVSVFVAGLLGSMLGEYLFPNRHAGQWYWVGPLLVGMIGYAMACLNVTAWTIGDANGALANLAHPLPLDYAGAGIAGALLGYWIGGERPRLSFFSRTPAVTAEAPNSVSPQMNTDKHR
jgi:hypothetical protein